MFAWRLLRPTDDRINRLREPWQWSPGRQHCRIAQLGDRGQQMPQYGGQESSLQRTGCADRPVDCRSIQLIIVRCASAPFESGVEQIKTLLERPMRRRVTDV